MRFPLCKVSKQEKLFHDDRCQNSDCLLWRGLMTGKLHEKYFSGANNIFFLDSSSGHTDGCYMPDFYAFLHLLYFN